MFEINMKPSEMIMSWDYACELDGIGTSVLDLVR